MKLLSSVSAAAFSTLVYVDLGGDFGLLARVIFVIRRLLLLRVPLDLRLALSVSGEGLGVEGFCVAAF